METARRLVVDMIVNEELSFSALQLVHRRPVCWSSPFSILPTLLTQLLQCFRALIEGDAVVVALRHEAGHVIHRARHDRLDALVHGDRIQGHSAPTADAD